MMRKMVGCLAVLVALLVMVAAPAAAAVAGLSARVDVEKSFVGRGERPLVTFTVENGSSEDVYLVRWQTPFLGIEANLFDVRRDGQPVAYVGMLAKRGQAGPGDYLVIPAYGSRTIRLDLSKVYDFSRTGEYSIRYEVRLQDAVRDATPTAIAQLSKLASNTALMGIERDDRIPRFEPARVTAAASNSYNRCDSSQQALIAQARIDAGAYSSNSLSYQNSHTASTAGPRYKTWFGTPTSSRFSTITSDFASLSSTFQNADMTFDCKCKKNYYAYVYPNQPYTIYLCRVFWQAPATGTDSKAGTLVHETSHFTVVAGTDDNAYGQSACKQLAISDPDAAVNNADSHEYFAENTPFQD